MADEAEGELAAGDHQKAIEAQQGAANGHTQFEQMIIFFTIHIQFLTSILSANHQKQNRPSSCTEAYLNTAHFVGLSSSFQIIVNNQII